MHLSTFPRTVLAAVEALSYKAMNKTPKKSLLSVTTPGYVIAKGLASKEKVIFVLKLLGPILPVHFHRFHKRNI